MEFQKSIKLLIQERMATSQQKQALQFNKHHRELHIEVGDQVSIHQSAYLKPQQGQKLHHILYGPSPPSRSQSIT